MALCMHHVCAIHTACIPCAQCACTTTPTHRAACIQHSLMQASLGARARQVTAAVRRCVPVTHSARTVSHVESTTVSTPVDFMLTWPDRLRSQCDAATVKWPVTRFEIDKTRTLSKCHVPHARARTSRRVCNLTRRVITAGHKATPRPSTAYGRPRRMAAAGPGA